MEKKKSRFAYRHRVAFGETDAAGVVFYPNYYKWMDLVTHEFFDSVGISVATLMNEDKVGIPLLESNCQYFSPLTFHDYVEILVAVDEIKDKTIKLSYEFYNGEVLSASGYEVRAWVSLEGGNIKAMSVPNNVRSALYLE